MLGNCTIMHASANVRRMLAMVESDDFGCTCTSSEVDEMSENIDDNYMYIVCNIYSPCPVPVSGTLIVLWYCLVWRKGIPSTCTSYEAARQSGILTTTHDD